MAIVIMLGAGPLAALMAADRTELGSRLTSSYVAALPNPSPVGASAVLAGEGAPQRAKNAASLRESAAASRVSHSQTTSADQPDARNALSAALSRARLRSTLARQ